MARGSIVKRSGTYYAIYRVEGKQKWEKAGRTKLMAEKLLNRRMDEINSGDFCEIDPTRFSELAERWLRNYALPNLKPSTYAVYEHHIRKHICPAIGTKLVHKISALDVQSFIASLSAEHGLSEKTCLNVFTLLRAMFKQAKLWGFVRKDSTEGLKRPRVQQREMDFLDGEELRVFLENSSGYYRLLFTMAAMTGLRQGELLGLQWGDINWKTSELVVRRTLYQGKLGSPKTKGSIRRVSISPMLLEGLREHYESVTGDGDAFVFQTPSGTAVNAKNLVRREFNPALKRAGLRRVTYHSLRHTFASLLIEQGENVKYIQQQLGHSSAKMTLDLYGHLMPGTRIDAGLRLDKTVFGGENQTAVRKLLENSDSDSSGDLAETLESIDPQRIVATGDN